MNKGEKQENKSVIGLFTTFYSWDNSYSLTSVCLDQLTMFVKYGYKTILFVLPSFNDEDKVPQGVEIRKVIPQLILEPYKENQYPEHWKEDAKKVQEACETNMQDIDILICHDIHFIDTYLPYNIGLRDALPKLKCKVFWWTHSAPSQRQSFENNPHANRFNMPPGKLVYLNHDKVIDLAEMYGTFQKDVRVVHNSRDPRTFWNLDPLTIKIIDQYNLLEKDIISVYPLSSTRMIGTGKRLECAIKIHSKLKELGYKTLLIVPNAHANSEREKRTIANTLVWAAERGINQDGICFTSLLGEEYEKGVSPKVVSDLFRLSNIFIFPTTSENSSLVLAEAMMSGNLLVLNKNVGTLLEHAGEKAIYLDFDYREPQDVNENYYLDLAKIISSEFLQDRALQSKRRVFQKQNYDYVYKHEILPILTEYEDKNICVSS